VTISELMRNNFDWVFHRTRRGKARRHDAGGLHRGLRLGTSRWQTCRHRAINELVTKIRKRIPDYRYTVVGSIQTMHTVGTCLLGSGLPGEPLRYGGTDVLEARDGRVAIFYTFNDSGSPPVA
jgi:hypothetical protein